jgi:Type II restriction endonuclease EcoO109I
MIDQAALQAEVGRLLTVLYAKRFAALDKLSLDTLIAKNPYPYRALGESKPLALIQQMLLARVSSSDETVFGNDFFEPLAVYVAKNCFTSEAGCSVTVGAGAGQDIAIETATAYLAISVKSGTNIFNSQSQKGQTSEFNQLQARMKKLGKMFRPIIGYGYGRKAIRASTNEERLAGQAFWHLLSGEENFYLRISRAMESHAQQHAALYGAALERKHHLLLKDFMDKYLLANGDIDWDAWVAANSSAAKPKRMTKPKAP